MQVDVDRQLGAEDCLYLNVFTPQTRPDAQPLLPLLVFVPGGAFTWGNAAQHGPDFIMEEGTCVLVTVAYRLGVFGWLDAGAADAPSNVGLRDLLAALRWVEANGRAFGGDPTRVTLMGQSAGAASVHALLLSPHAAGLFHGVVLQSGSLLCPWAAPQPRRLLLAAAEAAGCSSSDPGPLLRCLRAAPAPLLAQVPMDLLRETYASTLLGLRRAPMGVQLDGDLLPEPPLRLLAAGRFHRVPLMVGITDGEAGPFLDAVLDPSLGPLGTPPGRVLTCLRSKLQSLPGPVPGPLAALERRLNSTASRFSDFAVTMLTDLQFHWPAERTAQLHAAAVAPRAPVYLYSFEVRSPLFSSIVPAHLPSFRGSPHGGDLFHEFLMAKTNTSLLRDPENLRQIHRFLRLLLNFVSTGKPTPVPVEGVLWPEHAPPAFQRLRLASELRVAALQRRPQTAIWQALEDFRDFTAELETTAPAPSGDSASLTGSGIPREAETASEE